jgi:GAF domain-containing protein
MEPIPETTAALRLLGDAGDEHLGRDLQEAAHALRERVPGLVGFSISVVEQDVTFTYLTTGLSLAGLDGVPYLDGGPCEEAVGTGSLVAADHDDLLDEGRWLLFAGASRANGVASTLSLPLVDGPRVVGSVNVYGAAPDTFAGRHEELAGLFGAWAPGAVTNADLSFSSRFRAAGAVERLEDLAVLDRAVGVLVAVHDIPADEARRHLGEAAARAGVTELDVARLLVDAATRTGRSHP